MESSFVRTGFRRALQLQRVALPTCRQYATSTELPPVRAAPPISFNSDADQFARNREGDNADSLLRRIRIIPASPSYFTATPRHVDDLLLLTTLMRRHLLLPQVSAEQAPRVAWKSLQEYRTETGEPVRETGYKRMVSVLKRLNKIHPALLPVEVQRTLQRYKRRVQPNFNQAKPIEIDDLGRARAVGRRKSSHAVVFLVEGEGECLINGRSLSEYFGRLHDRESAVWALKATQRLDKYNVWAVARGGGTTGQAEAITLGVAKALLAHEPDLKSLLRKGAYWNDEKCIQFLTDYSSSGLCHSRPPTSREEEGWQAEGPQDACLGQAVVFYVFTLHV